MNKKSLVVVLIIMLGFVAVMPNRVAAGNLPETPITRILNYKAGLELSEAQIKNLNLVNNNIINKMLQVKVQAQNHKAEIDQAADNWSDLGNPKIKGAVKEYYQCQADLKALEFEAMVQASKILSKEQIDRFNELVTIELLMNEVDEKITGVN